LLKLEKMDVSLFISQLCAQHVEDDDVVAGNDARSRIWAVCGGSIPTGLSYGPIRTVLLLGFCGSGKEGSQNMGSMEAIWEGQQWLI
jgi:hypothetical protein